MQKSRDRTKIRYYLSAPSGENTMRVLEAVSSRNFEIVYPDINGKTPWEATHKALRKADIFIAVDPDRRKEALVEIGIALGLELPVILVRDPLRPRRVSTLDSLLYVAPGDDLSLGNALDELAKKVRARKARQQSRSPDIADSSRVELVLRKSKPSMAEKDSSQVDIQIGASPREFEESVGFMLRSLSDHVVEGLGVAGSRDALQARQMADFAIWIDEASGLFGNPLIVEAKNISATESSIEIATKQMEFYLRSSNAQTGLVVFRNVDVPRVLRKNNISIFIVGINFLITAAEKRGLGRELQILRNKYSHGRVL